MKQIIISLTLILFLTGCVSLQTVSLTQIPKNRTNKIIAKNSQWVFLGMVFNNNFVNEVVKDLKKQCPNGKVEGILTKYEIKVYLLFHKRIVTTEGYCNNE